jgi:sugar lactone lactonase YvrE
MSRGTELFLDGLGFGEGPRWREGRLWFSDFVLQQVASVDLAGNLRVEVKLDDRPSGLGWLPDGRLLMVAMRSRALLRRNLNGEVVLHADLSDVAAGDANDMVVGPDGTAYVGNLGSDLVAGEPVRPAKLAVVGPEGTVAVGADDLLVPNGSVITPAGDTLVVGESYAGRYRAFPIKPDGSLGEGRVWAELGSDRHPDGCTLDAEGAIWFANCAASHVARVVEGGEVTEIVEVPETAWACALGGEDGRTLFVLTCPSGPTPGHQPGSGRIWITRADIPHAGWP